MVTHNINCELENTFIVFPFKKDPSIINRSNMMLKTENCITNPQNDFKFRSMYRPTHYKHIYYISYISQMGAQLNRYHSLK